MQLEDYFSFLSAEDIRIKGTRIGIEHILYEYIYNGQSAEAISQQFHTVTLEQIYATILYYLHNQKPVRNYVEAWLEYSLNAEAEQDQNPQPYVLKLRALKEECSKHGFKVFVE